LFHKIEPEIQPALKTFLVFLNYLPSNWFVEVPLDSFIVDKLRKF
jgi:hypothetical protein